MSDPIAELEALFEAATKGKHGQECAATGGHDCGLCLARENFGDEILPLMPAILEALRAGKLVVDPPMDRAGIWIQIRVREQDRDALINALDALQRPEKVTP
jgi:hypothetical protein